MGGREGGKGGGGCIGEEAEGRVKKVGLREVQSRDRGSSGAPSRPFPYALAQHELRINCPDYSARRASATLTRPFAW